MILPAHRSEAASAVVSRRKPNATGLCSRAGATGAATHGGRNRTRGRTAPSERDHGQRSHRRPRSPGAQPQVHRRGDSTGPARRHHRPERLGKVLAGLRHHLRGGTAPLRRVAVGLCPPVPRADGKAGRRLDRRPVARHLHRAEDHHQEPALDGRHGHRDLRLPAPALRPGRRPALPRAAGDHRTDRPADGRPPHDAARGQPHHRPRAGDSRAQGRVPQAVLRPAAPGLCARARQRPGPRADRGDRARQDQEAHDRGRGRPPRDQGRARDAPGRLARDGAEARRGDGPGRGGGWRVVPLLRAPGLRRLRHLLSGGLAAHVLLQQPVRRVPGMRRIGTRNEIDPALVVPDPTRALGAGALRPWAGPRPRGVQADAARPRQAPQVQPGDTVGQAAEEARTSSSSAAPTTASRV